MKIVLTNDDGIDAPGLAALRAVCAPWGECVVVAPHVCHSSMSHCVTTGKAIEVSEDSENVFRVHGTPADCTRIALTRLAPDADWVIAGINRGGNLGADVYHSGTVAAAREAALLGRNAIAISHYVGRRREVNWDTAIQRATQALERLWDRPSPCPGFWNINLPHPADDLSACEFIVCPLDYGPLPVQFTREGNCYRYSGDYHARPRIPGHDVAECFAGKITATRMGGT
jgi:5'-nucleotidase